MHVDGIDYGMSYVSNASQFRFPIGLQIIFAIATFIGAIFLPESPRWVRAAFSSFLPL